MRKISPADVPDGCVPITFPATGETVMLTPEEVTLGALALANGQPREDPRPASA